MSKKSEAKKARKSAERKRTAAAKIVSTGKIKGKKVSKVRIEAARVRKMKAAKEMRTQGDILRDISGREKGQRTTFTGPAKRATLAKIKAATGEDLPTTGTKWQQVNKAWQNDLMDKDPKLTRAQARSKLKTIFANNRERFLTEQQRRYDANIVAPVLDDDKIIDLTITDKDETGEDKTDGRIRTRPTGGRGEYLATKYDRPGLLDWSDLAPPEMPGTLGTAPAQAALLERGLAAYQPWRRPGVGEAFKYQPPTAPTYATRASLLGGAGPSVADTTTTTADTGGDDVYNPFRVDPNKWTAPTAGGFVYDPNSVIPEFDQWSMWENQRIRDQNARVERYQDPTSQINRDFAFENAKSGAVTQNQSRQNQYLAGNQATIGGSLFDSPEERAAWLENTYREFPNWGTDVGRGVNVPYIPGTEGISPSMSLEGFSEAALGGPLSQQQMYDPQFAGSFPGMSVGLLGPR
jgi:hypothetical protein